MKKRFLFMAVMCVTVLFMFMSLSCSAEDCAEISALPMTNNVTNKELDDREFADFSGRFVAPAADINVALYEDPSQYVCDRVDSACLFQVPGYYGMVIADHNVQEFENLPAVSVGDTAYIVNPNGTTTQLYCVAAFSGHNTGETLTDGSWNNVLGTSDYLTYTCMENWQNVRICQWEIIAA